MKTFLIFKREGDLLGTKLGQYQAEQKDDTSANRSYLAAEPMAKHIELPEGLDADCVIVQEVEGEFVLVEDEALVAAKAQAALEAHITRVLDDAINFGQELIKEFTKENILMGITADGKTGAVRKTMSEAIVALQTGSLYDAIVEAKAVPEDKKDEKYITDERLLAFVNKIEAKLGLPLSTEL